jgi:hypothetical protein
LNGYELSFLRWFRRHGVYVSDYLGRVMVSGQDDRECPFKVTSEALERLLGEGYLQREFPTGGTFWGDYYVNTAKELPAAPPRTGRGIGGCKVVYHLRQRGVTVTALAEVAGVGRSALAQILSGTPGRGGKSRRKIARHLNDTELALLGWNREGKLVAAGDCSTENKCSTSRVLQDGGVA